MIGHGLAKCRVIHDQGRDPEPQQKSSQKIVFDEPDKGRTVAPKQRQEYRKKDPQPKLVEGPTDNSNFVVPGEGNARSPLGHLALPSPGTTKFELSVGPSTSFGCGSFFRYS